MSSGATVGVCLPRTGPRSAAAGQRDRIAQTTSRPGSDLALRFAMNQERSLCDHGRTHGPAARSARGAKNNHLHWLCEAEARCRNGSVLPRNMLMMEMPSPVRSSGRFASPGSAGSGETNPGPFMAMSMGAIVCGRFIVCCVSSRSDCGARGTRHTSATCIAPHLAHGTGWAWEEGAARSLKLCGSQSEPPAAGNTQHSEPSYGTLW